MSSRFQIIFQFFFYQIVQNSIIFFQVECEPWMFPCLSPWITAHVSRSSNFRSLADAISSNGRYHIRCNCFLPLADDKLSFMTLILFRPWGNTVWLVVKLSSHLKYRSPPDGDMIDIICLSCTISCQFLVYKNPHFTGHKQSSGRHWPCQNYPRRLRLSPGLQLCKHLSESTLVANIFFSSYFTFCHQTHCLMSI